MCFMWYTRHDPNTHARIYDSLPSAECNLHRTNAVQAGSLDLIDLSLFFLESLCLSNQEIFLYVLCLFFEQCPLQICHGFWQKQSCCWAWCSACSQATIRAGAKKPSESFFQNRKQWTKTVFQSVQVKQCKAISEGGFCGKHFCRKGKLVKRSGPFSEPLNSDNRDLLLSFLPKARFSNAPLIGEEDRKLQTESQSLAIFARKNHKAFCGKDSFEAILKETWIAACCLFRRHVPGMSREFCRDVSDPCGSSKRLCQENLGSFFSSQTYWKILGLVMRFSVEPGGGETTRQSTWEFPVSNSIRVHI